jgi:hypothetical protein
MNRSSAIVACPTALAVAAGAQAQISTVNMQFGGNASGMQSMVKLDAIAERVYLSGFSQGAGMAHAGGSRHADRFAAIAPVSGNIPSPIRIPS